MDSKQQLLNFQNAGFERYEFLAIRFASRLAIAHLQTKLSEIELYNLDAGLADELQDDIAMHNGLISVCNQMLKAEDE